MREKLFLLSCFAIGIFLRLANLDNFPPQIDEYSHTHAAIQLIKGQSISYFRALLTVTIPVFLSFKVFGISVFSARLPMIFLNMAAIFPLYNLSKKIHPSVGYISVLLYLVNPWIIASAQLVREYAVIPIFIFITLDLLSTLILEYSSSKAFPNEKYWLFLPLFTLMFYFPLFDRSSIISIIMGIFIAFFILGYIHLCLTKNLSIKIKINVFLFSLLGLGITLVETGKFKHLIKTGSFGEYPTFQFIEALFNNKFQNWNYFLPQIGVVFLLTTLVLFVRSLLNFKDPRQNVLFLISLSTIFVMGYLSLFIFNGKLDPRLRYGVLLTYHILPIVAASYYWIQSIILKQIGDQRLRFVIIILFFCLFWINYPSLEKLYTFEGGSSHFLTNNHHYIAKPAYRYLSKRMEANEPLLSNSFYWFNELNGNGMRDPIYINFNQINEMHMDISQVLDPYEHGWVALYEGAYPQDNGFPLHDFVSGSKVFEYLGSKGDVFIWSWSTIE